MSKIVVKSDIHVSSFSYLGNVHCLGNFEVDGDVVIYGNLTVEKDISINGSCFVKNLDCDGNIDISGQLSCKKLRRKNNSNFNSTVKIGYDID